MQERLNLLYGEDNVKKLSSLTVLVVGLGGVGGYAVEALARSGIGKLILVDYDEVSASNCNRQIIALSSTLGKKKTECFRDRILAINPSCQVVLKTIKVTPSNIETLFLDSVDFVLDACDSRDAKIALAKYTEENKIPFLMALGAGNRTDASKVEITALDKTEGDPLARKMRTLFRKEKLNLKIPVVTSKELPKKQEGNVIASSIFVPATTGLFAAQFIIQTFLKANEKN